MASRNSTMRGVAFLLLAISAGGCAKLAERQLQDIQQQAALDAEEQYRIVEKSGGSVDKCVRAGLVAEAYLQAKNGEKYDLWKTIERTDCAIFRLEQTQ